MTASSYIYFDCNQLIPIKKFNNVERAPKPLWNIKPKNKNGRMCTIYQFAVF
jgi:hypothetical protein